MPRTQSDDDHAGGEVRANPVRNPFERRVDRLERIATAVLILLFAATVPLSFYLADQLREVGHSAISDVKENSYRTTATLLGPSRSTGSGGGSSGPVYIAPARWTDRTGQIATGDIPARPDGHTGDTMTVWIDQQDGKVVDPPLDDATPLVAAIAAGFAMMLTSVGSIGGVLVAVRHHTNELRMREWEADWSRVEPLWSRRRDQAAGGEE